MKRQPRPETVLLRQFLETVPVGRVATFEELSTACGVDLRTDRGPLQSAKDKLFREKQMLFQPVPKIGIKRMSADDVLKDSPARRRRVHTAARSAALRLAVVNPVDLPPDDRMRLSMERSVALAATTITEEKNVQSLQLQMTQRQMARISIPDTLDFMAGKEIVGDSK